MTFTTATLCASFILYGGFNTSDAVNTLSLLSGFLVIFTGVYLLNISRTDPDGRNSMHGGEADGIATDIISSIQTRRSMQARRSGDQGFRGSIGSAGYGRGSIGDREQLMHNYDEEAGGGGFGLDDLAEDSEEEPGRAHMNGNGNGNGRAIGKDQKRSFSEPLEMERPRRGGR